MLGEHRGSSGSIGSVENRLTRERLQRVEQVLEDTLVYLRDQARRDKELEWDRVQALLEDLRETSK